MIIDTQNRGETAIRRQMAYYFSQYVPVYLATLIEQNSDLDDYKQPIPKTYDAYDPLDTKDGTYPVIGMYINGSTDYRIIDYLPSGAAEFNAIYEVTIFVAVVTAQIGLDADGVAEMHYPTRETTMRQRDDLLNAVVTAILNSPSLGTANTESPMQVDLQNMRKATPEPMKLQGPGNPRWVNTGLITINLSKWESTAVPIIGYANEVNTTVDKLPY